MSRRERVARRLLGAVLPHDEARRLAGELEAVRAARRARGGGVGADVRHALEVVSAVARLGADGLFQRGGGGMGETARDVRMAMRGLRRSPGFAAVAGLTLALGIGATTTVYGVVDAALVRALPYAEPDRLVAVWPEGMLGGELALAREGARSFEALAGYRDPEGVTVVRDGEGLRLHAARVTGDLGTVLGVRATLGRELTPADAAPGAPGAALVSHRLWREALGGDPDVVGSALSVEGRPVTVVGVLPAGLAFPAGGADLWLPLTLDPAAPGALWGTGGVRAVGRLRPGATAAGARAEMAGLSQAMRSANPLWTPVEGYRDDATVVPLRDALVAGGRARLVLLLGAVALVLLTACANVANLLLARGLTRGRELAVRAALGAGRPRIARQLLTESAVLAAVGGAGGVALAWLGTTLLGERLAAGTAGVAAVRLDARVLAASAAVTVLTGLLFGLAPALRAARGDVGGRLREGGAGGGAGPGRRGLSRGLVAAQVALSVVLLVGAGLLVRSLDRILAVDPGFRPARLVSVRVSPPALDYREPGRQRALYAEVLEGLAREPGVVAAEASSQVPFDGAPAGMALYLEGVTPDPNDLPVFELRRVTPGFLDLLGVPLLEGRALDAGDDDGAPLVGLVDEAAARRFWPGGSPVGARVRYPWRGAPWIRVVGVVGSVRGGDLAAAPGPALYVPFAQDPVPLMSVVARGRGEGEGAVAALRRQVAAADPAVAVSHAGALQARVRASAGGARDTALLLALFAGLALALVAVGLYGVLAGAARGRAREMGVRLALGAPRGGVAALVLGEGLALAGVGLAVGLGVALLAGRALSGMLYEVAPADPAVLAAVTALVALLAVAAGGVPAWRAASVRPSEVLRGE